MTASNSLIASPVVATASFSDAMRQAIIDVEEAFGCEWNVFHGLTGECLHVAAHAPLTDDGWLAEMIRSVSSLGTPQLLADDDYTAVMALPLGTIINDDLVLVAPFAVRELGAHDDPSGVARILGRGPEECRRWLDHRPKWPVHALERMAASVLDRLKERRRVRALEYESERIAGNLASTYEEISLLHAISQNLRLSSTDEELGTLVLGWLLDCLPARGIAIVLLPVAKQGDVTYKARTDSVLLAAGDCPVATAGELLDLFEALQGTNDGRPLVANRIRHPLAHVMPADTQQLIMSPMMEGSRTIGYVCAFNHKTGEEFGTVEANLLASVSAMLGIHAGNRNLYREQAEFLATVVRALTSAIDAKDPYTCGHSDRVARIGVILAKKLGCETNFLATVYMSGLLHDIGKIGIEDSVLRKPGKLTDEEFEHIKQHPALGCKILADIKQMADVLPAVLHHHEQWDGGGYPCRLSGDQIPFLARVLAVADAYDAMTSNRVYRPGLPEEKVSRIFRDGAGKQWDPEVVTAFFDSLEEIREICNDDRADLSLDVGQWV